MARLIRETEISKGVKERVYECSYGCGREVIRYAVVGDKNVYCSECYRNHMKSYARMNSTRRLRKNLIEYTNYLIDKCGISIDGSPSELVESYGVTMKW